MSDALFQNSFYIGNIVNGILYGVELMLYIWTIRVLLRRDAQHPHTNRFLAIFSTILLFLATIFVAVQAVFGQEMWIVNADFPGGPAEYFATHASVWYQTMGSAAATISQLMADALLIYRCFIVYGYRVFLLFPCVLWVATLVFGIIQLFYSGIPSGNIFVGLAANFAMTYVSVAIGLNVIVSLLICARIVYLGMAMNVPPCELVKYTGIIPIVVESALPYTLSGIAFVVSQGIRSQTSIAYMSVYGMFTYISPQLIIMRIANNKAWKRHEAVATFTIGLPNVEPITGETFQLNNANPDGS